MQDVATIHSMYSLLILGKPESIIWCIWYTHFRGKKYKTAQPRFTPINACQRLLIHAWTVCWNMCSATKPFWVLVCVLMNRNRCYPSQYLVTKQLLSWMLQYIQRKVWWLLSHGISMDKPIHDTSKPVSQNMPFRVRVAPTFTITLIPDTSVATLAD